VIALDPAICDHLGSGHMGTQIPGRVISAARLQPGCDIGRRPELTNASREGPKLKVEMTLGHLFLIVVLIAFGVGSGCGSTPITADSGSGGGAGNTDSGAAGAGDGQGGRAVGGAGGSATGTGGSAAAGAGGHGTGGSAAGGVSGVAGASGGGGLSPMCESLGWSPQDASLCYVYTKDDFECATCDQPGPPVSEPECLSDTLGVMLVICVATCSQCS